MRMFALLGVAVSSAALAAATPALADSRPAPRAGGWQGGARTGAAAGMPRAPRPMTSGPATPRPGGWQGGTPRPGGWHGGPRPGGWHGAARPGRSWGGQVGGRWWGGARAPGGWAGYHRPSRGYRVHSYWIAPSFYIGNWGNYGWPAPPRGYAWSRYYDDAVLIDGSGNVYDARYGIDWDRYDRGPVPYYAGDDDYYDDRDDDRDDRHPDDEVTGGGESRGTWRGTWTGSYNGGPVEEYEGEYTGGYRRHDADDEDRRYGADYPPPDSRGGPPPRVEYEYGIGAPPYGYGAPGVTTVTVQSAPVVTTTTTTVEEEVVYGTSRKVGAKRKWTPKAKPRCVCRK